MSRTAGAAEGTAACADRGEEETFLSQLEPKARALVASILIKPYEWNSLSATIAQVAAKLPK